MKNWQLLLSLAALACAGPPAERAAETTESNSPRGVVDSVFPVEEEIRRFKAQLNQPLPVKLHNALQSKEELVRRFVTALEQRDTAELQRLQMNAAEFIALL